MIKKRDANLDFLRGLCAVFVVFEHFCETSAHNAFGFTMASSLSAHIILRLIYGVARTAVPVFFLLSGYLSINSDKQRLGKVINLFFMTASYQFIKCMIPLVAGIIRGKSALSFTEIVIHSFPKNYYLYLFCSLYAFSPFLNKGLKMLGRKNYFRLCVVLFFLFSVWSTLINTVPFEFIGVYFTSRTGTSMGFNIANFSMMYIFGGYIRLYYKNNHKRDIIISIVVLLCSTIITTVSKIYFPTLAKPFYYYDSVFIIFSAIALLILFINFHIKPNRIITFMGKHTFGTFLIHGFVSGYVEKIITIESVVSRGLVGTIAGIFIFVIGVYLGALITASVLEFIASPINKYWKETKLYNFRFYLEEN